MDETLRALQRSWELSRDDDDLERYLQAESRASGLPVRWTRHKLGLGTFDPGRVAEAARAVLEAACATQAPGDDQGERPGYSSELYRAYNGAVIAAAGPWFSGLDEGWEPPWCPCHWLPRGPAEIERCVEQTLAQVTRVHAYERALVTLAETHRDPFLYPDPADHLEQVEAIGGLVIDLLIEATGCNESWYGQLAGVFSHVALGLGAEFAEDDAALESLESLIETRFSSWVAPSADARAEVQSAFASAVLGAGYGARG